MRENAFPRLNLPAVPLRLREEDGTIKTFDPLRDKYVTLTPEEFVRQHFTAWLRDAKHYPASLMANEIGIDVNGTRKRCDTVIFGKDGKPVVIVEYKAPDVAVNQAVFDQIVRYNLALHADYLVVSNGIHHYCCVIDYNSGTDHFIPAIADSTSLTNSKSE